MTCKAYRAAILHSLADPAVVGVEQSYEYFEDGILLIENGKVAQVGAADELLPKLAGVEIQHAQALAARRAAASARRRQTSARMRTSHSEPKAAM